MHNNFFQLKNINNLNREEIELLDFDFEKIQNLLIETNSSFNMFGSNDVKVYHSYNIKNETTITMIELIEKTISLNNQYLSLDDFFIELKKVDNGLIQELFVTSLVFYKLIKNENNLINVNISLLSNLINSLPLFNASIVIKKVTLKIINDNGYATISEIKNKLKEMVLLPLISLVNSEVNYLIEENILYINNNEELSEETNIFKHN